MRLCWAFIKWVMVNIVHLFVNLDRKIKKGLEYDTGETIAFFIIGSLVATLVEMMVVACFAVATGTNPSGWWVVGFGLTLFAYLVYTGVSVMFLCFKRERAELFETIKNGK